MIWPQSSLPSLRWFPDPTAQALGALEPPADLRVWLGEDRLLHLAIEWAAHHAFSADAPRMLREGDLAFPAAQLLALLAFCYLSGRLGSIEIEDCLETDEALRYLCGGRFPSSPVLRRFRRVHRASLARVLKSILALAVRERARLPWQASRPRSAADPGTETPDLIELWSAREAESRLARAIRTDMMALDV